MGSKQGGEHDVDRDAEERLVAGHRLGLGKQLRVVVELAGH